MAVTPGSYEAILSHAVGGNNGVDDPLASFVEVLTGGWWDGLEVGVFPPSFGYGEGIGDSIPIELLHPIEPSRTLNKLVYRTDNKNWVNTQKSTIRWGHEFVTLSYKIVKPVYMNTLMGFIESNAGLPITLETPGVQPFFNASESNIVYIKNHSRPVRVNAKLWTMDITFLRDPN